MRPGREVSDFVDEPPTAYWPPDALERPIWSVLLSRAASPTVCVGKHLGSPLARFGGGNSARAGKAAAARGMLLAAGQGPHLIFRLSCTKAARARKDKQMNDEFTSEDDLATFEGWLRYQGFDAATATP